MTGPRQSGKIALACGTSPSVAQACPVARHMFATLDYCLELFKDAGGVLV